MTKRRRTGRPRPQVPPQRPAPVAAPLAVAASAEGATTPWGIRVHALLGLVAAGHLDEHLGALTVAIDARQRTRLHARARSAAAALQVGDRVRVGAATRPAYLRGATGTVVAWSGTRAVVQLDAPTGGAVTGQVRCPPLALERVP